jgi:oligopeptidase B
MPPRCLSPLHLVVCFSLACAAPQSQSSVAHPSRLATSLVPPKAATKPHVVEGPAGQRSDEYYWLRDDTRSSPEMLGYLKAENDYTDAMLAPLASAKQQLLDELLARIPQEDATVPVRDTGYEYTTRWVRGGEYAVQTRRLAQPSASEEVLLDGNALARGHDYFRVGNFEVSDDGRLLAWTEDTIGRQQFTIHVKDLVTGKQRQRWFGRQTTRRCCTSRRIP